MNEQALALVDVACKGEGVCLQLELDVGKQKLEIQALMNQLRRKKGRGSGSN